MRVLIVETDEALVRAWKTQFQREFGQVDVARTGSEAVAMIGFVAYEAIILNIVLGDGESGLAVADYAQYRRPNAAVIFVTDGDFFSDGSIFSLAPNARAFLPASAAPSDIAALIAHYGAMAV